MTSGWSITLPSGWWHVALNDRRHRSVQALLNRLFANLPRDRVGPWRRELGEYLDAQVDAAVDQGATDLYLLSDHRYGLPVAASCLATVLPTAPPPGTPAQVLAVTFAHGDGEPGVVEVDGQLCARVRRQVPGVGTLPAVDADDPKHPQGADLGTITAAMPSTRLEVYVPFPSGDRMLLLSFSTPVEPLAEPMVTLFEAMAESLRWIRETP